MTKRTDISVPQGYFQNLEQRLSRIPQQEVRPTLLQKISPALAYAASLAVLVTVGSFVFRHAAANVQEDTGWDYISYLAQSLDPDGLVELKESAELTEEDIVNYLLANNTPVEQLSFDSYEEDY